MFKFLEKGRLPARWRPRLISLGLAALGVAVFLEILFKVARDPGARQLDENILIRLAEFRRPWLNGMAIDVTALGSVSLMALLSLVTLSILAMTRDRIGMLQLFVSVAGGALWGQLAKALVHRDRPTVVPHLVQAYGSSFPSGHSLSITTTYLALAFLCCRHFPRFRDRLTLFLLSFLIIGLVGLSRMYLGVHYASDVVSGICVGAAWALLVAAAASFLDTELPNPNPNP
ncbi:MAG: phosphatase PAP2 family protein [Thermoanaerobaculia bacterium]